MLVIEDNEGQRITSQDLIRDHGDRLMRVTGRTAEGLVLLTPVDGGPGPSPVEPESLLNWYTPIGLFR